MGTLNGYVLFSSDRGGVRIEYAKNKMGDVNAAAAAAAAMSGQHPHHLQHHHHHHPPSSVNSVSPVSFAGGSGPFYPATAVHLPCHLVCRTESQSPVGFNRYTTQLQQQHPKFRASCLAPCALDGASVTITAC